MNTPTFVESKNKMVEQTIRNGKIPISLNKIVLLVKLKIIKSKIPIFLVRLFNNIKTISKSYKIPP